jgi:MYXO-CTERM domain-containing protein
VAAAGFASPAHATTYEIDSTANLGSEVARLIAGDELVLRGGTYTLSARLTISVSGTASAPITIRGRDGEVAHLTRDATQNVINVVGARYLVLKNLEVSGGSHGIRLDDASFVSIEDCHVHDTGDVAISANIDGKTYQGLRLVRNHIHHTNNTGEGMYLGCNSGACTMFESVIEGNYIHDTRGDSVIQGDGIEIKQGSWGNIVRDNVIHATNYPCILLYGTASNPQNIVERNVMWDCGDHGIQVEADAVVRNNIVLGAGANGIHSQVHQQNGPENLVIVHNTVVVQNHAVRSATPVGPVVIANNALYSSGGSAIQVASASALFAISGNLGSGALTGVTSGFDAGGSVTSDFVDAAGRNVFPASGSKLIGSGDAARVVEDDFNATPRLGVADIGAYKYDARGNPGWPIDTGFKSAAGTGGTGAAAGASGAGATGGGSSGGGGTGGGIAGAGAGPSQSGGSAGAGAPGASGGSGGASADSSADEDGGCGCRTRASEPRGTLFLAVVVSLLAHRRRKWAPGRGEIV